MRYGLQRDYVALMVKGFLREFSDYVSGKVREDTIIGRIPHVTHAHGARTTSTDVYGYVRTSSPEPITMSGAFLIESLENGRGQDLHREMSATLTRAREAIVRAFYTDRLAATALSVQHIAAHVAEQTPRASIV